MPQLLTAGVLRSGASYGNPNIAFKRHCAKTAASSLLVAVGQHTTVRGRRCSGGCVIVSCLVATQISALQNLFSHRKTKLISQLTFIASTHRSPLFVAFPLSIKVREKLSGYSLTHPLITVALITDTL